MAKYQAGDILQGVEELDEALDRGRPVVNNARAWLKSAFERIAHPGQKRTPTGPARPEPDRISHEPQWWWNRYVIDYQGDHHEAARLALFAFFTRQIAKADHEDEHNRCRDWLWRLGVPTGTDTTMRAKAKTLSPKARKAFLAQVPANALDLPIVGMTRQQVEDAWRANGMNRLYIDHEGHPLCTWAEGEPAPITDTTEVPAPPDAEEQEP